MRKFLIQHAPIIISAVVLVVVVVTIAIFEYRLSVEHTQMVETSKLLHQASVNLQATSGDLRWFVERVNAEVTAAEEAAAAQSLTGNRNADMLIEVVVYLGAVYLLGKYWVKWW